MTKRQFERPLPGSTYSKVQREAWGAEQDRARAARTAQAAQGIAKPTAKRASRAKTLVADTSGSTCFDSLVYRDGTVTAVFLKDGSEYEYDVTLGEARDWFDDASLGGYFNDQIR